MAEFLEGLTLFPVVLTLGTYQLGLWCRKKWNHPLVNPLLIAVVLIVSVLMVTGVSNDVYQENAKGISWLLTPVTVCLALPLYEQMKVLKKNMPAILAGIFSGALVSVLSVLALCYILGMDKTMTVSLLPKSATSAMSMVLSDQNGGIGTLTAAVSILSGIVGSLTGQMLCKLLKITDPIAQGVAFGTAAHVVGTAKANEIHPLTGAVSSLSLVIAGILTAVLLPLAVLVL